MVRTWVTLFIRIIETSMEDGEQKTLAKYAKDATKLKCKLGKSKYPCFVLIVRDCAGQAGVIENWIIGILDLLAI